MKITNTILAAFFTSVTCYAQLPSTVVLAGAGYAFPRITSSACLAVLTGFPITVGIKTAGTYSYSCLNSSFYKAKPSTSIETGFDTVIACASKVCFHAIGTVGLASGVSSSLAAQFGGGPSWTSKSGFSILLLPTWDKTQTSGLAIRLLIGFGR